MKSRAIALALLAAAALPSFARAADAEPSPRIVVTGEGEAWAAPDSAMLSLSVLRQADTARAALDANSKAMAEVIAALKAEGIDAKDMQTSGFSISPRWIYPQNPDGSPKQEPPSIVGYDVVNGLSVRVRDLAKLGSVLDKSVTLGVNQGGQITFINDDPSAFVTQARKNAMADAISRAKTLTEAAGVAVGRILEISEQNYSPRPMPMMEAKAMMADAAGAPVPVEAGENAYKVNVNVTFEIRQ